MTSISSEAPGEARKTSRQELEDLLASVGKGSSISPRMPGLALPFAIVAATAALFAVFAFPIVCPPVREMTSLFAAGFGAIVGAIVGATLRRWRRLHDPLLARDGFVLRVSAVVLPAGVVVGGVVGAATWGDVGAALAGALGGLLAAIAFLPSCLVVVAAAQRAARARLGSLIANADRRTAWSTLLSVMSFAVLLSAPSIAGAGFNVAFGPWLQMGLSVHVACTSAILIAVMWRRDRLARTALEHLLRTEQHWLERSVDGVDDAAGREGREDEATTLGMDLGLGREQWGRPGIATYRTMSSTNTREVLVRGSIQETLEAFDDAFARQRRSLVFAMLVLVAVSLAVAVGVNEMPSSFALRLC